MFGLLVDPYQRFFIQLSLAASQSGLTHYSNLINASCSSPSHSLLMPHPLFIPLHTFLIPLPSFLHLLCYSSVFPRPSYLNRPSVSVYFMQFVRLFLSFIWIASVFLSILLFVFPRISHIQIVRLSPSRSYATRSFSLFLVFDPSVFLYLTRQ